MGDVRLLVKRLCLGGKSQQVEAKAFEYMRLASARLGPKGLGNAEVCKAAVCVDLACMTLQVPADSNAIILGSGVTSAIYKNARAMLQKTLNIRASASPRDLCIQFGCARIELPVRAALALMKERYSEQNKGNSAGNGLSDPRFLGALFYLVARKHRVKVPRERLLSSLGLTDGEFNRTLAFVAELVPEHTTVEKKEAKEKKRSSSDDSEGDAKDESHKQSGGAGNPSAKKKARKSKSEPMTEKKIREAIMQFNAAAAKEAEAQRSPRTRSRTAAMRG